MTHCRPQEEGDIIPVFLHNIGRWLEKTPLTRKWSLIPINGQGHWHLVVVLQEEEYYILCESLHMVFISVPLSGVGDPLSSRWTPCGRRERRQNTSPPFCGPYSQASQSTPSAPTFRSKATRSVAASTSSSLRNTACSTWVIQIFNSSWYKSSFALPPLSANSPPI